MFLQYGGEDEPLQEHEWTFSRVRLAQEFGWTLDYIDSLDFATVSELFGVLGGINKQKAYEHNRRKKMNK